MDKNMRKIIPSPLVMVDREINTNEQKTNFLLEERNKVKPVETNSR